MPLLQQVMCQRFAQSLRVLFQVLRIRRKRRDPIVGSDLLTWMRPNRRCQIGATHTLFNDRVRPVAAVRKPLTGREAFAHTAQPPRVAGLRDS
jgi:hypothetical protein